MPKSKKTVILCEKPSVGNDIAKALGIITKKDGHYVCRNNYLVTWSFGHLFNVDDTIIPKKWDLKELPIFPERFKYSLLKEKGIAKQFKVIKELLQSADAVIIATDAGREGELIARLILAQAGWKNWGNVYRLWTSKALTPEVVRAEISSNLKPASQFDSLYYSALARQHSDWIVGINFTRIVTLLKQLEQAKQVKMSNNYPYQKQKSNWNQIWSVGRVQTPVLKLIVEREKEIKNFKPIPYGVVKGEFEKDKIKYTGFLITKNLAQENLSDEKLKEKDNDENKNKEKDNDDQYFRLSVEEAKKIAESLQNVKNGTIISKTEKIAKIASPLLYNLNDLQRDANKFFGFSPAKTLALVQELYEKYKVVSYPRTESRYLSQENKKLVLEVLGKLDLSNIKGINHSMVAEGIKKVGKKVFDDSKLTDHHALIPLAEFKAKSPDEKELQLIYDLIKKRFIATFLPNKVVKKINLITEVKNYKFLTEAESVVDKGWEIVYDKEKNNFGKDDKNPKAEALHLLKEKDVVDVKDISFEKRFTKPPSRYTEASLLKLMEKLSLGTAATRAEIIRTLFQRNYIVKDKKQIIPTDKGIQLIIFLDNCTVSKPEMTSEWEVMLDKIYKEGKGKKGYQEFFEKIKNFVANEAKRLKESGSNTFKRRETFIAEESIIGQKV